MSLEVSPYLIFVVSSDQHIFQQIRTFLPKKYQIIHFPNWEKCSDQLHQNPQIIFLEWNETTPAEYDIFDQFTNLGNHPSIILFTENNNPFESDFSQNPCVFHQVIIQEITQKNVLFWVKNILQIQSLQERLENVNRHNQQNISNPLVFNCPPMQTTNQLIRKASKTNIHCFLFGEKGTGKHTSAHLIHSLSDRKKSNFIHCNLSSIAIEDLEKVIFGIEKEEVTHEGKLEQASQGTLYLEDVNMLPLKVQARLLNTLQTKTFSRVGGNTLVDLDIRLIVSAKENLQGEMSCGHFMEKLYYLLMGLPIELVPLKDRGNDILLLSNKIIVDFCQKNTIEKKELTKKAKKKLLSYSFPGNIVELKSTLERALVLSTNPSITEEDIEFLNASAQLSFLEKEMTFEEYKSRIIHHYLEKYDDDIMLVSNKLDIGKSTIYRMLKSEKEKSKNKMSWLNMF